MILTPKQCNKNIGHRACLGENNYFTYSDASCLQNWLLLFRFANRKIKELFILAVNKSQVKPKPVVTFARVLRLLASAIVLISSLDCLHLLWLGRVTTSVSVFKTQLKTALYTCTMNGKQRESKTQKCFGRDHNKCGWRVLKGNQLR